MFIAEPSIVTISHFRLNKKKCIQRLLFTSLPLDEVCCCFHDAKVLPSYGQASDIAIVLQSVREEGIEFSRVAIMNRLVLPGVLYELLIVYRNCFSTRQIIKIKGAFVLSSLSQAVYFICSKSKIDFRCSGQSEHYGR